MTIPLNYRRLSESIPISAFFQEKKVTMFLRLVTPADPPTPLGLGLESAHILHQRFQALGTLLQLLVHLENGYHQNR